MLHLNTDIKRGTLLVYQQVRRNLIDKFGANTPLSAITVGDAKVWRRWLTEAANEDDPQKGGQGLSDNTARKRCAVAKQFFADAVDHELIDTNPFGKMKELTVGCKITAALTGNNGNGQQRAERQFHNSATRRRFPRIRKCRSSPGGIRTPDQGIMSPLL